MEINLFVKRIKIAFKNVKKNLINLTYRKHFIMI